MFMRKCNFTLPPTTRNWYLLFTAVRYHPYREILTVRSREMDGVDFVPLPFKDGKNSLGDKAASSSLANSLHKFEAVCEDVSRILRSHENGTTPKEEVMLDASSKETASPQDPGAQPTADVPSSSSK